jgi:hypothetical protein
MKLFSWLISGPKAAEKVLDAGISGIDKIFHTDEEKSDARQKLFDGWKDLQKVLGEETTIRSVTRRILAFIIMGSFTFLVLYAAIVWPFNVEYAKFLLQLAESKFGWMAVGVAGFYFGPNMIGRMRKK